MLKCINELLGAHEIGIAIGVLAGEVGLWPLPPILMPFMFLRIVLIHAADIDALEAEIVSKPDGKAAGIADRRCNAGMNDPAIIELVEVRDKFAVMNAANERPHITVTKNQKVERKYK